MDDLYYLEPGFDLNTLTVPRLRSILVAHDISYPSSAKKGDLIDIIQDHLLPQAKKLLRQRDRVRRTSRGITDVPSSQESNLDDDTDKEVMPPPPPPPKTPRGRKSKSDHAQDEVEPTPRTSRRSKTPSTRKTAKTPRISESDTDTMVSARKPRKSTVEPVAPTPATASRVSRKSRDADESPFTQDNPFQQGSSPIPDSTTVPSTSRSRRSVGASSTRKSTDRRRTRSPTLVKREEFEIPVSHLSTGADNVEVTEEFTEDARAELAHDIRKDHRVAKVRNDAIVKAKKKPQSTTTKAAPWTVLSAMLLVIAGWYRQQKVAVGYCGVGQAEWAVANVENIPVWVNELGPQCEPCPNHATCYPSMKAECEHDFVLREHPLSLNGIIPLPPTCEPDSAKEKKIEIVTRKAIHELRENTAEHECGASIARETSSNTVAAPVKLGLSEDELKERVMAQRRKAMPDGEFEDLWNSALGVVKSKDEVVVKTDKSTGQTVLTSTSFANLPFTCAVRRSLIRTLAANRIPLLLLVLSLVGGLYGRQRLLAYTNAKSQTPSLVALTLDRLATQAAMQDQGRVQEAFISVGQLRDDVLRNVFDRTERERVWSRVKDIVESNSNVRAATREGGKTGEWSRVWEWIGPVNFVPGLEGRQSGGLITGSPGVQNGSGNGTPAAERERDEGTRKWDEGTAYY